jgi:alanine racemase
MPSRRLFLASTVLAPLAARLRVRVTNRRLEPFDPWVEVYPGALRYNAGVISRLSGGRPILAVIKNNAYGLGLETVAQILEPMDQVVGFAVVKTEAALALRAAGIQKPVLHMGLFDSAGGEDLVREGVSLSLYTDDAPARVAEAVGSAALDARAHLYIDTGMSRMGMPYHRALPWIRNIARVPRLTIDGMFMGFTEEDDFDREQLRRFRKLGSEATREHLPTGPLHAASSAAVFNFPDAHLQMVRPGIALYGAYPSNAGVERQIAELHPAFSLKARVVRVEQLRAGDSVSYGRNYIAERPIWVATLPVGHTDGISRRAVNGAVVQINGQQFPAVGAVSASHTMVAMGDEPGARIGDVATFLGPGAPEIHPNDHSSVIGASVYDTLMHLNPGLPRIVVGE